MSISLRKTLPLFLLFFALICLFLLPKAYADGLQDLLNAIDSGQAAFTVAEDTTIPENVHVESWDTELTVKKGVTLTVQGSINANVLKINGTVTLENWGFIYAHEITLGSAGQLNITGNNYMMTSYDGSRNLIGSDKINFGEHNVLGLEINVSTRSEFNSALNTLKTIEPEHFMGEIRVIDSFSLSGNTTVDLHSRPVALQVADGATLTVPSSTTLNAERIDVYGSTLQVNGKLIGNAGIQLQEGGKLSFANDNCYVNNVGAFILLRLPADPDAQILGLDMDRFTRYDRGNEILFTDNAALFADLKAACQRGDAYYDLSNKGVFNLDESLTIPEGMTVDATNTSFGVPVGNQIVVEGKLILSDWNFFGQTYSIVIPEGGELHILTWRGLAANIWEAWMNAGSVSRVTFEDNAGIMLEFHVANDREMQHAYDVSANSINGTEHVICNIHVHFDAAMPGSVTFPQRLRVYPYDNFTIPEGVTLTVIGTLSAQPDVVINVEGTLINNGFVEMEQRTTADAKLCVSGAYAGGGTIGIKDHDNVESYISGVNLSNFDKVEDDVGTRFFYKGADKSFASLKTACARGDASYDLTDAGDITIEEDLVIPEGMTVIATGTRVIVPVGKKLTVEGTLILTDWNFNGQTYSIVVPEGGELQIMSWHGLAANIWWGWMQDGSVDRITFAHGAGLTLDFNVEDDDQFRDAFGFALDVVNRYDNISFNIHVHFSPTVPESVTIPGQGTIILHDTFTIPSGSTLTVYGTLTAAPDVVMNVEGTLVNNNFVEMEQRTTSGTRLNVTGTYLGAGTIGIRDPDHPDPTTYISGVDMSKYRAQPDNIGTRYFYNGSVLDDLKAAIAAGLPEYDMRNRGTVVFSENITIPAGMLVRAAGTEIVIPASKKLTIAGQLNISYLRVETNGQVVVNKGHLNIMEECTLDGTIKLTDDWADLSNMIWDLWVQEDVTGRVTYSGDSGFRLHRGVINEDDLGRALLDAPYYLENEHLRFTAHVRDEVVVTGSMTIPQGVMVQLEWNERNDPGVLIVEESGTLTNNGSLSASSNIPIVVFGTLINNAWLEMLNRIDTDNPMLYVKGTYLGTGNIGVKDHNNVESYISGVNLSNFDKVEDDVGTIFRYNGNWPSPDLILPASLIEIDEEAFAGGAFAYPVLPVGAEIIREGAFTGCPNLVCIYIPETTETIIGQIFDSNRSITIFGRAGSYAQTYADSYGNLDFVAVS